MSIFQTGLKVLFSLIALFLIIFSILCYMWSAMHPRKERIIIAIMTTLLYGFLFFLIGLILLFLVSFFWQYFPGFGKLFTPFKL